jgi:DNA ligase (NAD+)
MDSYTQSLEKRNEQLEELLTKLGDQLGFIRKLIDVAGDEFCITGSLETMTREQAKKLIESRGSILKSAMSSSVAYLVTNNTNSGTIKNKEAAKFGITVINEQQFIWLMNM